jgi:hypothetical protein
MYALFHPQYMFQKWHVFITYVMVSWICCSVVAFANHALPALNNIGLFLIISGVVISIIVCAVMPGLGGGGYATSTFVWQDWENRTGYSTDGLTFLMDMLNGAYAMGTPGKVKYTEP